MDVEPSMASVGALIGSPARASMLALLFDGRALTATELGQAAGVSPATTSEHLARLVAAGLLICEKHGRHRYYSISGSEVAEALEPLVHLVNQRPVPARASSPEVKAIREARLCYDHLAGRLGVMITSAMAEHRLLITKDRDYLLTNDGEAFCTRLEINVHQLRSKRRMFARQCLDWSERKPHLAGALGAAVADLAFKHGWIKRTSSRRAIRVTQKGRQALSDHFGVKV